MQVGLEEGKEEALAFGVEGVGGIGGGDRESRSGGVRGS